MNSIHCIERNKCSSIGFILSVCQPPPLSVLVLCIVTFWLTPSPPFVIKNLTNITFSAHDVIKGQPQVARLDTVNPSFTQSAQIHLGTIELKHRNRWNPELSSFCFKTFY